VAEMILQAVRKAELTLANDDILVVAQKIISKAEGRQVRLADITPSADALELSRKTGKDPRLAELILRESKRIVRTRSGVAIVEHRLGLIHANAGIDQSNIEHEDGESALLLPVDPDASAAALRAAILKSTGCCPSVIISDSTGRPWRLGTSPVAIGASGVTVLTDETGDTDLFGRSLLITKMALGDQLAAAAGLLMGESLRGWPVVLIRGLKAENPDQQAQDLIRPSAEDMFRDG